MPPNSEENRSKGRFSRERAAGEVLAFRAEYQGKEPREEVPYAANVEAARIRRGAKDEAGGAMDELPTSALDQH